MDSTSQVRAEVLGLEAGLWRRNIIKPNGAALFRWVIFDNYDIYIFTCMYTDIYIYTYIYIYVHINTHKFTCWYTGWSRMQGLFYPISPVFFWNHYRIELVNSCSWPCHILRSGAHWHLPAEGTNNAKRAKKDVWDLSGFSVQGLWLKFTKGW